MQSKTLVTKFRLLTSSAICASLLAVGCGDGGNEMTLEQALSTNANKKFEEENYKPNPKPRPEGHLPPPSSAEFKAWDRKDPQGEKHLYKWDKKNAAKMEQYFNEIKCFREALKVAGKAAWGAEPQTPQDEKWYQFKRFFIPHINGWQQRLFGSEPRILEKSKFIGNFLEAHELVMKQYPEAFNSSDDLLLKKADAHWLIVEKKVVRYMEGLKYKPRTFNMEKKKDIAAWEKLCEVAMTPPKEGPKKQRGKKTPI